MKNVKVLVAEDNPDILTIMSDRLKFEGYDVVTAVDGDDAWARIGLDDPDIVLLDLMMPKMDGYEVLKRLREDPPSGRWRPVIIVSAKGELQDLKRGFDLEADHYITKPWRMEDILQGVRMMVTLSSQRKPAPPNGTGRRLKGRSHGKYQDPDCRRRD